MAPSPGAADTLFKQAIEIPTVQGRGQVSVLVKLLSEQFRNVGLTDITVKPHGALDHETDTKVH